MSADPLFDAANAFDATMEAEADIYRGAIDNAAALHTTSINTARDTYMDACYAAGLLYAQSIDAAWHAFGVASDQARHVRDAAGDAHRHAITDPGYPAIGRMRGLAEIRGVMTALASQNGLPL